MCVFVFLCVCVFVTAGWVSSICCVCVADTAIRLEEQHRRELAVVNTNSIAARQRISIQCTWTAGAEYTAYICYNAIQCKCRLCDGLAVVPCESTQKSNVDLQGPEWLWVALSGLVVCEASRKVMLTCKMQGPLNLSSWEERQCHIDLPAKTLLHAHCTAFAQYNVQFAKINIMQCSLS